MSLTEAVSQRVSAEYGLVPRSSWPQDIGRALTSLGKRYGCKANELVERIEHDAELLQEMAGLLTIGETHFLRHTKQFESMSDIVASWAASEQNALDLSVWSAGCASGEEPYSIAITLIETLGQSALETTSILGTDINGMAIAKARAGIYSAWSFRGCPPRLLQTYFEPLEGKGCRISESVRKAVVFEQRSLTDQLALTPARSVHLLFFRNVGIYLKRNALEEIVQGFERVLHERGILVTAPSDPPVPRELFRHVGDPGLTMFRLAEASGAPSRRPAKSFDAVHRKAEWRLPQYPALTVAGARHERPALGPMSSDAAPRQPLTPAVRAWNHNKAAWAAKKTSSSSVAAASSSASASAIARGTEASTQTGFLTTPLGQGAAASSSEQALAASAALISSDPKCVEGYLLRGQVHLEADRSNEAIADFRSAVFLDSANQVARFWYAVALRAAGDGRKCLGQLRELRTVLTELSGDTLLSDGETTANELLDAARTMEADLT